VGLRIAAPGSHGKTDMQNQSEIETVRRKQRQEPRWELAEEDVDTGETPPTPEAMRLVAKWLVRKYTREMRQDSPSFITSEHLEH